MNQAQPAIKNPLLASFLEPRRVVFIVNPNSGTRQQARIRSCVEKHLNHRKFEYTIWDTEAPGHATELAKQAVAEQYDIVVAVGGDGSVNEVAAALIHTEVELGIVPAGSGNGLAMHLGYGRNLEEAVRKLNSAQPQLVDCGLVNGQPFVNVAGVGFDGLVSNLMKGQTKRGLLPYFLKSVQAGLEYRSKPCIIEANGTSIELNCFAISVANGPMYGYNVSIAPDAILDDGLFSVVILKDAPRWQYFAAVPATLTGKILKENFVEHLQAASVTIRSEGENFVHLDGEGFISTDVLKFEVAPKSLRILVPK